MLIEIHPQNPQPRQLRQVVEVLENDGVIIYPTDTVYGLGCNIFSKKAIKRIGQIKQVDAKRHLTFICANQQQIQEYAQGIDAPIFKALRRHLPGPYTFLFKASKVVPKLLLTKRSTIGVRWPHHIIATSIVEELGNPILSSSLHSDEERLFDSAWEIHEEYGRQVDLVVDGGDIFAEHSTIIDFTAEPPEVVRQGKGPIDWLDEI
jgi:tRNA threonylcarbamoyl adenosine modification protein (Sua5/YciO/YrdC/YwlC family)